MFLSDIYPNFITEDKQYECKLILNDHQPFSWLKTVVGFANKDGGILFVGVNPKDFSLIGLTDKQLDKEKLYFFQQVKLHIPVTLNINCQYLSYQKNEKDLYILVINIAKSPVRPVILMFDNMPLIYVRRDGYTSPATTEEIRFMTINSEELKYDLQDSDVLFDLNNFHDLNNFFKERTNKDLNIKHLRAINFFNDQNYLKKGALLFMDNYLGENTKIVCSLFASNNRGDDFIIASNSFQGNLIKGYHFINDFIVAKTDHGFIKKDNQRIDIDSYPPRAVFEAIVNALAHRNYLINGSQISVDLFPNRLVITSCGDLYGVGDIKPTYNLANFISKRRNDLICNIFMYCLAMEAKGTGFEKIMEEYRDSSPSHRPFIFAKNNQFSIVLCNLLNSNGVDLNEESLELTTPIQNQSTHDLTILAYCYEQKRKISDIAKHLNISNSSYLRNKIIGNLVSQTFLLETQNKNLKEYATNRGKVHLF